MSIVTYAVYVSVTGDDTTASGDVEDAITEAEGLIGEFLRRPLAAEWRSERYHLRPYGMVYPRCVPVLEVSATASYQVYDTAAIQFVTADSPPSPSPVGSEEIFGRTSGWYHEEAPRATVVYLGGWDADTIPYTLRRGICYLARAIGAAPPATPLPPGATSLSLGDASISLATPGDADGAGAVIDGLVPGLTATFRRYRWRPL